MTDILGVSSYMHEFKIVLLLIQIIQEKAFYLGYPYSVSLIHYQKFELYLSLKGKRVLISNNWN